ncbi:DUF305 domain-containing protein [Streptomyces tremellae]|uniref:DUF305 domain-containing protein n=1 Tax=Streptomyces tremellae TaxID=1124239 RepID=A0ABP7FQZ4_9ACTN
MTGTMTTKTTKTTKTTAAPAARPRGASRAASAAALAVLALAACGGTAQTDGGAPATGGPSAPASPGPHNTQDTAFAQAMIPHHRQALAMAALAPGRAGSAAVRTLAARVRAAQRPEITLMTGWLTAWNAGQSPTATPPGRGGTAGMTGTMGEDDMAALRRLRGQAFDRAFLTMMIGHHQGALAMARAERSGGVYAPARKLAASIEASQGAEIARMHALLGDGHPAHTAPATDNTQGTHGLRDSHDLHDTPGMHGMDDASGRH